MKFKQINCDYFVTILDRLTRLEPANVRYKRVFDDIINKFCIDEKLKNLSLQEEIAIVEEIFNSQFAQNNDSYINDIMTSLEKIYFKENQVSYQYLSSRLNISLMLDNIQINEKTPKNVVWLKKLNENRIDLDELRKNNSLYYPIKKIILCEGQTEYTLLESVFKLFGVDFGRLGYLTLPAGGKNQVARKYYQMIEYLKLPFFVLLDKDAQAIKELMEPKLRQNDVIYLLKSGEFEDLIPKSILQKTINTVHSSDFNCIFDDFLDELSMVENLENIYKKYGFGEFKKAKFALELKEYIENNCTLDDFKNSELIEIIEALK